MESAKNLREKRGSKSRISTSEYNALMRSARDARPPSGPPPVAQKYTDVWAWNLETEEVPAHAVFSLVSTPSVAGNDQTTPSFGIRSFQPGVTNVMPLTLFTNGPEPVPPAAYGVVRQITGPTWLRGTGQCGMPAHPVAGASGGLSWSIAWTSGTSFYHPMLVCLSRTVTSIDSTQYAWFAPMGAYSWYVEVTGSAMGSSASKLVPGTCKVLARDGQAGATLNDVVDALDPRSEAEPPAAFSALPVYAMPNSGVIAVGTRGLVVPCVNVGLLLVRVYRKYARTVMFTLDAALSLQGSALATSRGWYDVDDVHGPSLSNYQITVRSRSGAGTGNASSGPSGKIGDAGWAVLADETTTPPTYDAMVVYDTTDHSTGTSSGHSHTYTRNG